MKLSIFDLLTVFIGISSLIGFYIILYLVWDGIVYKTDYQPVHIFVHSIDYKKIPVSKEVICIGDEWDFRKSS